MGTSNSKQAKQVKQAKQANQTKQDTGATFEARLSEAITRASSATTPDELYEVLNGFKDVQWSDATGAQAARAAATLQAAVATVNASHTDPTVSALCAVAKGSGNPAAVHNAGQAAAVRLMVQRIGQIHNQTGFHRARELAMQLRAGAELRARTADADGGGGGGGGGGVPLKPCNRFARGVQQETALSKGARGLVKPSELDRYGNPVGEEFDLARPEAFQGRDVVVFVGCPELEYNGGGFAASPVFTALTEKGFNVRKCVLPNSQ